MVFHSIIFELIKGEMEYVKDLGNIENVCHCLYPVSLTEKYLRFTKDVHPTTTFDGPTNHPS